MKRILNKLEKGFLNINGYLCVLFYGLKKVLFSNFYFMSSGLGIVIFNNALKIKAEGTQDVSTLIDKKSEVVSMENSVVASNDSIAGINQSTAVTDGTRDINVIDLNNISIEVLDTIDHASQNTFIDWINWYVVSYWTISVEFIILIFAVYIIFFGKILYFRQYMRFFIYILTGSSIFLLGTLYKYEIHVKFFFGEYLVLADNYSVFFKGIFLLILALFFSSVLYKLENTDKIKYSVNTNINAYNYYLLIICIFFTFFVLIFISSFHLLLFYLAMECLNFIIIGYFLINYSYRYYSRSAVRYFCINAVTSGLFLFALLIMYGVVGYLDLYNIRGFFETITKIPKSFELFCVFFFFVSFIKIGVFPFTFWLPSLYEDSSYDLIFLFGVIFKLLFFFIWFRICVYGFIDFQFFWKMLVFISGLFSLIIGTFGAVKQKNLRRFISFTSVAHMGFLVILMMFLDLVAYQGVLFYALNYLICLTVLLSLFVISHYKNDFCSKLESTSEMMFFPVHIKVVLTVIFLSLAGFPPTIGYFTKWYGVTVPTNYDWTSLVVILTFISLVNFINYLTIIRFLWLEEHLRVLTYREKCRILLSVRVEDPIFWVFVCVSIFLVMSTVAVEPILAFFMWLGENGCSTILTQMTVISDVSEVLNLTYTVNSNLNMSSYYVVVLYSWFYVCMLGTYIVYYLRHQVIINWKTKEIEWKNKDIWWKSKEKDIFWKISHNTNIKNLK